MSVLSCLEDNNVDEYCWSRHPVPQPDWGRIQLNRSCRIDAKYAFDYTSFVVFVYLC